MIVVDRETDRLCVVRGLVTESRRRDDVKVTAVVEGDGDGESEDVRSGEADTVSDNDAVGGDMLRLGPEVETDTCAE